MSFRGASAGSLASLRETLDDSTSGTDLFAVAAVLRSEPGLRRIATDVAIAPDAKAGLVREVFGGKVADGSGALVERAVQRRWTSARDLADALEQLGVIAVVRSASSDAGRLADELFGVAQLVKDNPDLRDALSDPSRSISDKGTLVHGLLDGKVLPATVTLVEQALAGTHRTVGVALNEYQRVAAEVHQERVATVRVARPLSDAEKERLGAALERQYHRPVHLNVVVDPVVIGGIRVEIGDDVIDGTVLSRLDDARRQLAG